MIDTDEVGDSKIEELKKNVHSGVFNDWEKQFIRELNGTYYDELNKSQKAVVTRLHDWLNGE